MQPTSPAVPPVAVAEAVAVAIVMGVVIGVAGYTVVAQEDRAAPVMAATRAALGGESRLAGVRTLIANGRTRQVRGDNLIPIEFEIQVELPDKYARRDEFPAQDAGPATTGFNGDRLIQIPPAPTPVGRPGAPPPDPTQIQALTRARVAASRQDFTRLMVGLFAGGSSAVPLTFLYVGQAEAPQGKADVVDVKGEGNFAARLFIDAQTHLPLMLTWQAATAPPRRGGPPPAIAAGGPPPPAPTVEQRMYFADYRSVDGIQFPFRIRRAAGAETTEETTFDRFRINARTDPRRFDTAN